MQCKQAHEYAHIKCNQSKFMSLLPLLVCFSCPRILILLYSSMLLPLCPCPTSTSPHDAFHIFVPTSLPLSSISIKGVLLIDTKDCIGVDGWHLNLAFFMDNTIYVGMTPHVGSLTLIPIGGALSRGQNHGKHSCSSRCQNTGLRWLGCTQEHKNHREDAMVYPRLGQLMPYIQQLMILILKSTQN